MSNVFAIKEALAPHPSLLTFFCVRSYWNDRGVLAEGRLEQFPNMELALRAGKRAAAKAPAVRVFRVRGNVGANYWEDPVTVARFGNRADELRLLLE